MFICVDSNNATLAFMYKIFKYTRKKSYITTEYTLVKIWSHWQANYFSLFGTIRTLKINNTFWGTEKKHLSPCAIKKSECLLNRHKLCKVLLVVE